MGAISSDIVYLLKVKLSLQTWPEMASPGFLVFKTFQGEDPRTPPPPLPDKKISDLFFNPTLLNTSL